MFVTTSHLLKKQCCLLTKRYSTSVQYSLFNDNSFQNLVQDLTTTLKDAPKQKTANVREVLNLLRFYESMENKENQWNKFAIRDKSVNYTRNMVTDIGNHSKLLVLVWEPGKQSTIHDHPNTHCFMKILKGQLQEKLYDPKTTADDKILKRTTTLPNNGVAYITDDIGLHQIKNPTADVAISLHLYVPIIFDQLNGSNSIERTIKNYI